VVSIHTTADYVFNRGSVSKHIWIAALAINSFSRWAVPVFIMISGAVLIPRYFKLDGATLGKFYKRRLLRTGGIALVWSGIYLLWNAKFDAYHYSTREVIENFLLGNPYLHLYFLYLILGLYLVAPFLGALVKQLTNRQIAWLTVMLLVGASVWDAIGYYYNSGPVPLGLLGQWVPYVAYFLAGYTLTELLRTHKLRPVTLAVCVVCLLPQMLFVYLSVRYWHSTQYFEEYFSPTTILQSLAIFVLGKYAYGLLEERFGRKADRCLSILAPLTLGIYLIHVIVLQLLERFIFGDRAVPSTLALVLLLLATIGGSALAIIIIKRLPLASRYLMPE
jgi:surface polysaccharide O-acyltransferase-like enzyme